MVQRGIELQKTRPEEWLEELGKDLATGAVLAGIVRLAILDEPARRRHAQPQFAGWPEGEQPLEDRGIEARHYVASYVAHGLIVKCVLFLGLAIGPSAPDRVRAKDRWRERDRETSDQEMAIDRIFREGVIELGASAEEGLPFEIRSGNLHGEDPTWRGETAIREPASERPCATCKEPIYFANQAWRHRNEIAIVEPFTLQPLEGRAGRAEVYAMAECATCRGTRQVFSERYQREERCQECTSTPGRSQKLHHLADPDQDGRTV